MFRFLLKPFELISNLVVNYFENEQEEKEKENLENKKIWCLDMTLQDDKVLFIKNINTHISDAYGFIKNVEASHMV